MHVGDNAVLAGEALANVIHVVIYNGVHCSTGSQSLSMSKDNLLAMAEGLAYRQKFFVDTEEGLRKACESASESTLIVVAVNNSVSKTLPRPSESAHELREMFMKSFI